MGPTKTQKPSEKQKDAVRREKKNESPQQQPQQTAAPATAEKKPGFFRRVWNWVKGVFSRMFSSKSNTKAKSGEDTMDTFAGTQVQAPAPDPVLNTLPPEQTPAAKSKEPEQAPEVKSEDLKQVTAAENEEPKQAPAVQSEELKQALEAQSEKLEQTAAATETLPAEEATEDPESKPAEAPQLQEGGSLTLGGVTLTLQKGDGDSLLAMAGSAQVLGQQVNWTSEEGVRVLSREDGSVTANGTIHLRDDRLDFEHIMLTADQQTQSFQAGESARFLYHGGELDLTFVPEGKLEDLSALTGKGIRVENRTLPGTGVEPVFEEGTITLSAQEGFQLEGVERTLEEKQTLLPSWLQAEGTCLTLAKQGDTAALSVQLHQMSLHMGNFKFLSVDTPGTAEAEAQVDAAGNIVLAMPAQMYFLRLFNGKVEKNVTDLFGNMTFTLNKTEKPAAIQFHPLEFSAGGFQFHGVHLEYDFNQGFSARMETLSGLEGKLTGSNIQMAAKERHFEIASAALVYDDPISMVLKHADFTVNQFRLGGEGVFFEEATAGLQQGDPVAAPSMTVVNGTVSLRKQPGELQIALNASSQFEYDGEPLELKGNPMTVSLSYIRKVPQAPAEGAQGAGQGASQGGNEQMGGFEGTVSGQIHGEVKVGETKVANVQFTDQIALRAGTFLLGNADAFLDFRDLSDQFSGIGTVKVRNLSVSAAGATANEFVIYFSEPTVFGKKIGDSILLKKDAQGNYDAALGLENDLSVSIGDAEISLKKPTFALSIQQDGLHPGLRDTTMRLTVGDTIVESEIETLQLGSEIRFGSVALRNQTISDMVEDAVGIKDLSLKVYDLTIAADLSSFTVGAIGAEIGNSISLFGSPVMLEGLEAAVVAPNLSAVEGIKLGGGLKYEGDGLISQLGGKLTLGFLKENQYRLSVESCDNIVAEVQGYGKAEIGSISKREGAEGFIFKDVSIEKSDKTGAVGGQEDSEATSMLKKMIAMAPTVDLLITEVCYGPNGFELDPRNVLVKSLQSEVKINDHLKLVLSYQKEKGQIGAELRGDYYLPEERKKDKQAKKSLMTFKAFVYPIFPMVTVDISPFLNGGIGFEGFVGGAFASGSFTGSFGAQCNASLEAGVGANLEIGVPGLHGVLGLAGSVSLNVDGNANGTLQLLYDSTQAKLLDAISLDRENTKLTYGLSAGLDFDVYLKAGLVVPSVFDVSSRSLMKSWNLFHYNLGNATIQGQVFYIQDQLKFVNDVQLNFNKPGAISFEQEIQRLEKLTASVQEMEERNQEVCRILDENAGTWGLGQIRNTMRLKQSIVLLEMLQGTMKESAARYIEVHQQLAKLHEQLPQILEKAHRVELIRQDTLEIANAAGIQVDDQGNPTTDWHTFVEQQKQKLGDEEYLNQLASKDPLAVFNTFKAYKYHGDASWGKEYDIAKALSKRMRQMELQAQNGASTTEKTDSAPAIGKSTDKLLRDSLKNTNSLLDEHMKGLNKVQQSQLEIHQQLTDKSEEKAKLQEEYQRLISRKDQLSGSASPKEKKELDKLNKQQQTMEKKLSALNKEIDQKQKKQQQLDEKMSDLSVAEKDKRQKSNADSNGEGQEVKKIVIHMAAIDRALIDAGSNMEIMQEERSQQYGRITASRTQEVRERFQLENKAFVKMLMQKLIAGTPQETKEQPSGPPVVTYKEDAAQDLQVKTRAAQVSQGSIIEERIKKTYLKAAQGRREEEWLNLQKQYFESSLAFQKQHQQAVGLYGRLISNPFSNEDDKDISKVNEQNALLQETCTALNTTLSTTKIAEHAMDQNAMKDLNRQVAALAK